ncbi:PREDICTED: uncharacterized protein LOC104816460 [Tarenaya hassleriana]|uniref:uncharacterized protein LOC104816460 n=1 Tax=Tarenaya hassleriana TaxID=28532 RepID=UPI00053C7E67|nr:PREDICTED: uncharacterized protein LOC104816460 [Tarenaya hassleriana]
MPSVGMRRTTRVFGVVKAADGARVLRSGRRLWPNSGEPKVKRAHDVDEQVWDSLLKDHGKSKGNKTSGSSRTGNKPCSPKVNSGEKAEKEDDFRVKRQRKTKTVDAHDEKPVDKMFGIVYSRKRKRLCPKTSGSPDKSDETLRRLKFYCRRRRVSERVSGSRALLTLVVDWSYRDCWFSSVFGLVIRYLRSEKLRLSALIAFFMSQPINNVYADHGIKFLLDPPDSPNGICKFFGAVDSLPLFSVDFAAVPPCFMDMNITLVLRMIRPSFIFVKKYLFLLENGENQPVEESDTDVEEVITRACNSRDESVLGLHPSTRASKLSGGNAQYRGGLGSHSFQKRRSSFRRRRARNLSHGPHKSYNGVSFSDLTGSRKNGTTFSSTVSPRKLRSSMMNKSALQSSEVSSPKARTKQELDSLCCSANILVIDPDRCMREGGFEVMLELSPSKEWHVVIKKDGTIRYTQKAQKMMRPCSSSRFTHSIIWAGDDNWKLEFCDRQDWLAFKDIYKECYERNVLEPNMKVIPIPGVREVPGFLADTENHCSFSRPVSYISVKEDEVSRALARSSATYDFDSEDEEWLKNHNGQLLVGDKDSQQLQLDTFEMMIDGFEKACFRIPCDDLLDEKATTAGLSHLGKQEVLEAVYSYWARKRKQRKAPLLRVFQGQQVKKTPLLSKPVFRKRRSFKRQGSQLHAKAKQLNPLQVKVPEQDNSEEENALAREEEAKALAETTMEIAITKRQRAQAHAENADLAVYKAMMALRIAEAIRVAESSEVAATLFLN